MWELDHKQGWVLKNWCFQAVVLQKTLESPLDCKIKLLSPKGNQPWYPLEGLMLKLKLQYFGHLLRGTDWLEKTLMLAKIKGRRKSGWQRMRWLDGNTDSIDMNLRKLLEMAKDREALHATVDGGHRKSDMIDNWKTTTKTYMSFPGGTSGKESGCQYRRFWRRGFSLLVGKIPWLEMGIATHCSFLAWRIPWTEKPATVTAKSLQSCLTLCDPIDSSPPGSPVPGILQARTLEWVAISFSNAWKWKVKVKSLSLVRPSATPWTAAFQAPPSMGFSRQTYWSGVPLPSPTEKLGGLYSP